MREVNGALWPLVGRASHLDRCTRALRDGRGVLLAGGAGVGKTAIARSLADSLDDDVTRLAATATTGLPIEAFASVASGGDSTVHTVFVDDVQLLDDDAAALLHRLTVEGRIVVVGTLRTGETAPDAVTALWKDDLVERIDLEPLDRSELDELIDLVLDGPIDAGARRTLWDLTLGWPLMFRELIRSSLDSSMLRQVNGLWRFIEAPASARLDELVSARLDQLDPTAYEIVELLALGEPIGFDLLRTVVSLDAIDLAERAGVVEIVSDDVRRDARLAHPMFGDVTRRRMTEVRRGAISARLLALLETTPMRRRDDIVRATTWQLQAGGTTVTDDMVLAARRALYGDEQRLAVELATRALKGDPSRKDVALLLAEALIIVGEPIRADEFASGAVDEATDVKDRALLAMQRAFAVFWGFGDAAGAEQVIEQTLAAIPEGPWFDELLAERAVLISNQGRHRDAAALVDPLLDRPDLGDRAFVTAAISACCSRSVDGRCIDALALCERAFATSTEMGPQVGMTQAGIFIVSQVTALTEAGRFAEAEGLARAAHAMVLAEGRADGQAWFSMTLGRLLLLVGQFEEAEQRFVEASAAFAGIHSHGPRHWSLAGAIMAAASRGDAARARGYDAEHREIPEHPAAVMAPEMARADAYLAFVDGDRTGAIRILRDGVREFLGDGALTVISGLLHDIVRFGGTVEADEAAVVEECQGELVPARLALFTAERSRDAPALEVAAAEFERLGSPLYATEAWLLAATQHGRDGDSRAESRCRRAASACRGALGEHPIVTLELLDRPDVDVLTRREREVAELAAQSRTNKEIAEELFVSVRTVENHLQRVYDKLGVDGRRNLADAVLSGRR